MKAQGSEAATFGRYIAGSLVRIVACLDGLSEAEVDWRPPAPEANSLRSLAIHSTANAEENVLGVACGLSCSRAREHEFSSDDSPDFIRTRLRDVLDRMEQGLADLSAADLDGERDHPRRGKMSCREVLIVAARHAAEHMGQAELTRDLVLARRQTGS